MARHGMMWAPLAVMVAALLLTACGGGEESGKATSTATPPAAGTGRATVTGTSPAPTGTGSAMSTATPRASASPLATPGRTAGPSTPAVPSPAPALGPRVDFDLNSADNGCPNDGANCSVGPIDECVSVTNVPGTTFDVDVVMTGLANGFSAFNYNVYFDDKTFAITKGIHADPTINLAMQSKGSDVADLSADLPTAPGSSPLSVGIVDWGTVETTPPFTQGVLGRYEFTVATGAASGLYDVHLEKPPLSAYLDQNGDEYVVDPITTGLIALGQECP